MSVAVDSFVPVTLTVSCRTSQASGAPVTRHPVTIHEDWTVTTGHDLAAERVVVALGGSLSCLELVDRTVPAARRWLELNTRSVAPSITSTDGRRWRVRPRQPCCPRGGYSKVGLAASHVRGVDHLATEFRTPVWQLEELVGEWEPLLDEAGYQIDSRRDRQLWQVGLSPAVASDLDQRLGAQEPLPVEFHLAVHAQQPDLGWLRAALAATHHDPGAATWLAWHARQWRRVETHTGLQWLRLGIPPRLALALADAPYEPSDLTRLAAADEHSLVWAALQLTGWRAYGYQPSVAQLLDLLADPGPARGTPPSPGATQHARTGHPHAFASLTDTDIALLIAKHGDAASAAAAARSGSESRARAAARG